MARYRTTGLKPLPDPVLADALARAPADQHLIWNGRPCPGRSGSIRSRALRLVEEIWQPVPLRILISRAARLSGLSGLDPDTVRNAVRMHQSAGYASYFLVRRTGLGDYVAIVDVPYPSCGGRLREGEVVLSRTGDRYDGSGAFVCAVPSAASLRRQKPGLRPGDQSLESDPPT